MYSKNSPVEMSVARPIVPSNSPNPISNTTSALSSLDNAGRQGWVGDERVEIVEVNPSDQVGSVPSPSLTLENLIAMETHLSAGVSESEGSSTTGAASKKPGFWSKTDLVTALSQYQNTDYLRRELQRENLPLLRNSVQELKTEIQKISPQIPERAKLEKLVSNLIHKIDAVIDGRKTYVKFSTKVFFALASISLGVLPLLVAGKNKYNQVLAVTIAGNLKTLLILLGLMFSQTADSRTFVRHLKERHIPNLTPSIPFAIATYNRSVSGFNKHHPWEFNGIAAVFCAMVFMMTSSPDVFKKPINKVLDQTKALFESSAPKETEEIPRHLLESLMGLFDVTREKIQSFLSRRHDFEGAGHAISDVLSNQVNDIHHASALLEKEFLRLFQPEDAPQPKVNVSNNGNPDFSKKMVFTILAMLLCVGSAATLYDEPVGLVGLGVDSGLVTGEMLKTAFRSSENVQRASEKFASYTGITPFFLLFGLVDKLPKKHFTDSIVGLSLGTAFLFAAAMTLPRVTSELLSKSVLHVLNQIRKPNNEETRTDVDGAAEHV